MIQRYRSVLSFAFILGLLLMILYLGTNQDDYYTQTLLPQDYTDMTSDRLFLEKGTYTFSFSYEYTDSAEVQIVRIKTADENNTVPLILASEALNESGETTIVISLEQAAYDVEIRFTQEVSLGFTQIYSQTPTWNDTPLLLWLTAFVAIALFWMYRRKQALNDTGYDKSQIYILLTAVAVYLTLPLMRGYFVEGHDLIFHLTRIESIKDSLLAGQFPSRIAPTFNSGIGFASSTMYPDLFLYIPALLRLCNVSLMASYQCFIFLINLSTLLITYHAMKRLTGKATIGLIISLVYSLSVYRFTCLYTRAAIGELLAMIFLPCVMLGMKETLHQGKITWLVIGMSGIIQSHILSVEIAGIFCAVYTLSVVILRKTTWRNMLKLGLAGVLTALLNLWFLIPFLRFLEIDFHIYSYSSSVIPHAVYPSQLFSSFVSAFGSSAELGTTAEMPLSVGLLLGFGILLFVLVDKPMKNRSLKTLNRVSLLLGLMALAVTSTVFPWSYVATIPVLWNILNVVQYSWRYLGISCLLLSVVFGVSAFFIGQKNRKILLVICLALSIFNVSYIYDQFIQAEDVSIVMESKYDGSFTEELSLWDYYYSDSQFFDLYDLPSSLVASDDIEITNYQKSGTQLSFDYTSSTEQTVTLPLYHYPGYQAFLNETQELTVSSGDDYLITLILPAGSGQVSISYEGFWYYDLGDIISLLTLLGILGWFILSCRKKRGQLVHTNT